VIKTSIPSSYMSKLPLKLYMTTSGNISTSLLLLLLLSCYIYYITTKYLIEKICMRQGVRTIFYKMQCLIIYSMGVNYKFSSRLFKSNMIRVMRAAARRRPLPLRNQRWLSSLIDEPTSVDIHKHKLSRPKLTPKDRQSLDKATKVSNEYIACSTHILITYVYFLGIFDTGDAKRYAF
jgi:hypothetical protein